MVVTMVVNPTPETAEAVPGLPERALIYNFLLSG
jgi:hypothetical protein